MKLLTSSHLVTPIQYTKIKVKIKKKIKISINFKNFIIILIGPGPYYTITALERDQYEVVLCSIKPHIDQVQV
jgi:hypothetical protein